MYTGFLMPGLLNTMTTCSPRQREVQASALELIFLIALDAFMLGLTACFIWACFTRSAFTLALHTPQVFWLGYTLPGHWGVGQACWFVLVPPNLRALAWPGLAWVVGRVAAPAQWQHHCPG
jgi:hypothetical protein